jgi:PIN like domain
LPSGSPLEFFIDRSLGRRIVPGALRDAGATVHPMAQVYGERVGQGLADTEWLHDAGANRWVVLMKDGKIRYRPAELEALMAAGVRAFCLTNANLGGQSMAERFVAQRYPNRAVRRHLRNTVEGCRSCRRSPSEVVITPGSPVEALNGGGPAV